ncbi:hypothetical protein [Kitasatospora mediocidica]|uniref:hypothetical protein n=1 Tax=Kitasatospora mediocidica TaxID=58352 RepID=UPI00056ACABF|nr:hypothetical protein [Kitasatospora mediocidica]
MSLLASLLRMRAATTGNAVPTSQLRHLHLSDRPLMMLPLEQTGPAARPLAVMLGTDPRHPQLLVAPPSGSTAPMLGALAATVTAYIDEHQQRSEQIPAGTNRPARRRYTDAPQILVPNPKTVAYLDRLGRDLRFRPADTDIPAQHGVPRLGQWLTHFADRAEIPGSCALVPLTGFLTMHWITGQSPLEDEDLALLLAWIDPPRDAASGRDAALAAEHPDTHRPAGPATDARFDTEQLAPLFEQYARTTAQPRALQDLERLLAHYLQPTWDLMWQAYTLLHALPEADSTARRWNKERSVFTDFSTYLIQDGRPQAARDQAVSAAVGLARREEATAAFDAERAMDDPFARAELRTAGRAFAGTVTTVDADRCVRPKARRQWRPMLTVSTTDPVSMEPGQLLACHAHRNARYKICDIAPGSATTQVQLEITAGMGPESRPNYNVLPDPGDLLTFTAAPDHYRLPEFPPRNQTPWTHGGPPAEHPDHEGEER